MIFYVNLIFIVIAVSLDGFGVGVTYGMRKIKISFAALIIIMLCSGMIVLTSMLIGQILQMFITPQITNILGSIILITLGLFVLTSITISKWHIQPKKIKQRKKANNLKRNTGNKLSHFKSVISDPHEADKDRSGSLSVAEAFVLGTALALDALGAGLGAAMLGYSPVLTSILIATMSGAFVYSGIFIGFLLAKNRLLARLTYLPPIILLCIGVYNLV